MRWVVFLLAVALVCSVAEAQTQAEKMVNDIYESVGIENPNSPNARMRRMENEQRRQTKVMQQAAAQQAAAQQAASQQQTTLLLSGMAVVGCIVVVVYLASQKVKNC